MNLRRLVLCLTPALSLSLAAAPPAPVAALAHIQPTNGVLSLNGPPGDAIAEVRVTEGAKVPAGATIMVLQSAPAAQAEVAHAEAALQELREQQPLALAQLQLDVRQAEANLAYASSRLARYGEAGTATLAPQLYSDQVHQEATARVALENRRNQLAALQLQQGTALSRAAAQLAAARARLDQSCLRAPTAGTILELLAGPGEPTGARPVVRLADLDSMCVVADVFEGDLRRVRVGATAVISSASLAKSVTGRVVQVGRVIAGEGKVGKVKILADDPAPLVGLIDAEVDVLISE